MAYALGLRKLPGVLVQPGVEFRALAEEKAVDTAGVLKGYALWLGLLPPVCAFIGSYTMGWDMGVGEALQFGGVQSFLVGLGYFLALGLVFGVCGALAHWMSGTYGADVSPGHSFAFMSMVGTPLMIGGLLHLYPHAGLNILFLVPVAMWSVYLLYTGVPVVYGVNADRGMLMASSILGVLFVGVVAIMIATVVAWVHGFGPNLGFDWSSSLAG